MYTKFRLSLLPLILVLVVNTLWAQGQFKALLITETDGWHHESIATAIPALKSLAARHHFSLDSYQSGEKLTEDQLNGYDVVILLNTTQNIFTEEEQGAFEKFIQSGKGYVGIHSASDTEYDWDWYTQLVGRMFRIHPAIQTAWIEVKDSSFPGFERWPQHLLWTDEYYEFTEEKTEGLNYLLTVDENTYNPHANWGRVAGDGMGAFHPLSWYHEFDGGRSFYTALGHMPEVYSEKLFLEHVYGGIYWAATGKGLRD